MAIIDYHTNYARFFLWCPSCGELADVDRFFWHGQTGYRDVSVLARAHHRRRVRCSMGPPPRIQVRSCTAAALRQGIGHFVPRRGNPAGGEVINEQFRWSKERLEFVPSEVRRRP